MARRPIKGVAETVALFDRLPDAAKTELGAILEDIGQVGLQAEERDVPRKTGALAGALKVLALVDQLRVRVGLIGLKAGRGKRDLFYGRIVNFGRQGQTVVVQRRRSGAPKTLRNRRKRVEDIVATYRMKVRPMAARPFVTGNRDALANAADAKLADFWARALARSESEA
jgi:hypothetical protein